MLGIMNLRGLVLIQPAHGLRSCVTYGSDSHTPDERTWAPFQKVQFTIGSTSTALSWEKHVPPHFSKATVKCFSSIQTKHMLYESTSPMIYSFSNKLFFSNRLSLPWWGHTTALCVSWWTNREFFPFENSLVSPSPTNGLHNCFQQAFLSATWLSLPISFYFPQEFPELSIPPLLLNDIYI